MALSKHEQELLDDLERSLHTDDQRDLERVRLTRTIRTWKVLAQVFVGVVLIQVYLNSVSAGIALTIGVGMAYGAVRLYRHSTVQAARDADGRPRD